MKDLKPAERLIVALDYSPGDCKIPCVASLEDKVLSFAKQLAGSGVCVKINSVLRAYGYLLIAKLHELDLRVMADLKLVDIPATLEKDGQWLEMAPPEILTVMACAGIDGMHALQKVLGDKTEILAVTVLTSLNEEECQAIFSCSTKAGVLRFARMAQLAKMGGLILSPKELEIVNHRFELLLSLNTPGIRPEWSLVENDDQSRVMTPKKAILAGADRLVIGRPITKAKDPLEAVKRTLDEIQEAVEELKKEEK